MFLVNFFKFLFLFLVGYLIYSLLKLVFHMVKNSWEQNETNRSGKENKQRMDQNRRTGAKNGKIIELDKDQYKVE